jgi:hypothetical protein
LLAVELVPAFGNAGESTREVGFAPKVAPLLRLAPELSGVASEVHPILSASAGEVVH